MKLIDAFWRTLEPSPAEIEAEIEAKLAARKARRQINSQRSTRGHSTRIKNAVAKALSVFGDRYEAAKKANAGRLCPNRTNDAAHQVGEALQH